MENSSPTAFRCPSCGALTQAASGEAGQVVCRSCGFEFRKPIRVAPRGVSTKHEPSGKMVQRDVVSRRRIETREQMVAPAEPPEVGEPQSAAETINPKHIKEEILEDGTRKVMKRRRVRRRDRKRQLLFLAFSLLVVTFTVLTVREFINDDDPPVVEEEDDKEKRIAAAKAAEVQVFVQKHINDCHRNLMGFLAATNTEARAQFVREPIRVTPRMSTYYQTNLPRRPKGDLSLERSGLKLMGEVPAIETVWRTEGGEPLEVVFVRFEGRWVIDWEEFVRYASMPWHQFMAGEEGTVGEFRLYVRQRQILVDEGNLIGVQFYPPLESPELRQRGQSPRVLLRLASDEGRFLKKAIEEVPGEPGTGDSFFGERDPEGMKRVRVVLEWDSTEEEERFLSVKEVRSANWWGDGFGKGERPGDEEPDEATAAREGE